MKAEDAKRISHLLRSLDDLSFETAEKCQHPDHDPAAYADDDLKPLPFMLPTDRVAILIMQPTGDTTTHRIATVDVAIMRRACAVMAQITRDELATLGVVIE